jgi:HK97 family phage portal protein
LKVQADILAGEIDARRCPVTAWSVSNVVGQRDGKDNLMFAKGKSRGRIDPVIAATIGRCGTSRPNHPSTNPAESSSYEQTAASLTDGRSRPEPSRVSRMWQALRTSWTGPITSEQSGVREVVGRRASGDRRHRQRRHRPELLGGLGAVNMIATQMGNLPLVLYKKDGADKSPYKAHRLYRLLHDRPNPETSAFTFKQHLQGHVLLWGNGYAEIERDRSDQPIALWPITPERVTPYRDRPNGPLEYKVLNPGGGETFFAARDILHVPGLGYDGVCGYSVIAKARESIGLGLATEKFGGTFFGNGSTFGGAIEHPGTLTETARKNLRESIEARHQGVDRAHKFIVLEEGMKYEKFGIPPNDAQFLETRTFQVDEIARWFNLPPHKLKELARSTNNNIEHQNLEYYIDCLAPWCEVWEQELNFKLVSALERQQQEVEFVVDGSAPRGQREPRGVPLEAVLASRA